MIFFFDANGNPIQNIPQKVYQGSNKASVIYFAYPLSSTLANVVFVNAAFNLPNGFNTEPQLMVKVTDTGLSNITDAEGNVYSVWQLSLTAPITSYSGNVTCQFFVTTSSAVVATASSQFFVEKGVLPVNPPSEGDSHQELLQYITDILTPLANEVENLSNSYYPRQTGVSILENLVKVQDGVLSSSIAPNIIAVSDNTVTNNLKAQAPAEDDEIASIYNNYLPKKDGVLVVKDDVTSAIETALVPIQRELDDKYNKVDNVSIDTMGVTVIDASDSGDFAGLSAYGIELVKNGTPTNLSSQETADSSSVNLLLPKKSGTLALDGDLQDLEENITINTNNIKALFNLQLEKNVLVYDNAELTEEVQQTGGSELANLTILDGSYATVNKISGDTVASENLIDIDKMVADETSSPYYSNLSKNTDGSFTITNGANGNSSKLLDVSIPAGTYTISYEFLAGNIEGATNNNQYAIAFILKDSNGNNIGDSVIVPCANAGTFYVKGTICNGTFTLDRECKIIQLVISSTPSKGSYITFNNLMLNTDSTAQPYIPYFEGLKNAQLSGIKSIGKNLYDNFAVSATDSSLALSNSYGTTISTNNANDEVVVTQVPNSSYGEGAYQNGFLFWFYTTPIQEIYDSVTVSFDLEITANPLGFEKIIILSTFYNNAQSIINGTLLNKKQRVSFTAAKKTSASGIDYATFFEVRCGGMSFKISNFQVCASTASLPTVFTPYTEITMQLPKTFELGKWDYITFNEDTGVATIVRRTSIEAFNEQDYNEAENTYQGSTDFVLSANKELVARIDNDLPDETFVFDSNKYLVGDKGIEQVLTPTDTDGMTCFDYGANTTEENSYYVIVGDNV